MRGMAPTHAFSPRVIRAERRAREWSQRELAERSGVSIRTIVGIEKEGRYPTVACLVAVADALGVHPGRLFVVSHDSDVGTSAAGGDMTRDITAVQAA